MRLDIVGVIMIIFMSNATKERGNIAKQVHREKAQPVLVQYEI